MRLAASDENIRHSTSITHLPHLLYVGLESKCIQKNIQNKYNIEWFQLYQFEEFHTDQVHEIHSNTSQWFVVRTLAAWVHSFEHNLSIICLFVHWSTASFDYWILVKHCKNIHWISKHSHYRIVSAITF